MNSVMCRTFGRFLKKKKNLQTTIRTFNCVLTAQQMFLSFAKYPKHPLLKVRHSTMRQKKCKIVPESQQDEICRKQMFKKKKHRN